MSNNNKIFKNLDEQIQILIDKGLIINDVDHAKEILLKENYFFISGYRHLFMKSKKQTSFIEGTTLLKEEYAESFSHILQKQDHGINYLLKVNPILKTENKSIIKVIDKGKQYNIIKDGNSSYIEYEIINKEKDKIKRKIK